MEVNKSESIQKSDNTFNNNADPVEIVYYTDPLCCWSWAFEPQWRRLRYEFANCIKWRYCMGGLIPSWKNFNDTINAVSRPAQMGPVWMEASHLSGMPIYNKIWIDNPPASSYLSCIAVKCAELQSPTAGEKYLRLLREAVMLDGKNISLLSVLLQLAEALAGREPQLFDLYQFKEAIQNEKGLEAFRMDLQEVQARQINRFPTLLFRRANYPSLLVSGYRPYAVLLAVMKQMAVGIQQLKSINLSDYNNYWGSITEREIKEVMEDKPLNV